MVSSVHTPLLPQLRPLAKWNLLVSLPAFRSMRNVFVFPFFFWYPLFHPKFPISLHWVRMKFWKIKDLQFSVSGGGWKRWSASITLTTGSFFTTPGTRLPELLPSFFSTSLSLQYLISLLYFNAHCLSQNTGSSFISPLSPSFSISFQISRDCPNGQAFLYFPLSLHRICPSNFQWNSNSSSSLGRCARRCTFFFCICSKLQQLWFRIPKRNPKSICSISKR